MHNANGIPAAIKTSGYALTIRRRPRGVRHIRPIWLRRLALLLVTAGLLHFVLRYREYRAALIQKYQPTHFANHIETQISQSPWRLDGGVHGEDVTASRRQLLEDKANWKKLGSGYEGDTFVYHDTVIKTFDADRSPLRNCVPKSRGVPWPPEIPASIGLGGIQEGGRTNGSIADEASFLPVQDFFYTPAEGSNRAKWHLLTPFLAAGNLDKLARTIRQANADQPPPTYRDLDMAFRPSFERLLAALEDMHTRHGLCHDDIKPDNIFVARYGGDGAADGAADAPLQNTHWLLADLGNVRHPSHPYHTSRLWAPDNAQLPDCRANDARRLLRSYMLFLRAASSAAAASSSSSSSSPSSSYSPSSLGKVGGRAGLLGFDDAFFAAAEPWAALYWHAVGEGRARARAGAATVRALSEAFPAGAEAGGAVGVPRPVRAAGVVFRSRAARARAVGRELAMGASELWAKVFGLWPLVGLPGGSCAAG